jgi:hypothetical protein
MKKWYTAVLVVSFLLIFSIQAGAWFDKEPKHKSPKSGKVIGSSSSSNSNSSSQATSTSNVNFSSTISPSGGTGGTGGSGGAGGNAVQNQSQSVTINNVTPQSVGTPISPSSSTSTTSDTHTSGALDSAKAFRQFPVVFLPDSVEMPKYTGPNTVGYNILEDWTMFPRIVYAATADRMDPNDIKTTFRSLVPIDGHSSKSCTYLTERPKRGYVIAFTFASSPSTSIDLYGALAKDCMRAGAHAFLPLRKTIEWSNESGAKSLRASAILTGIFGSAGEGGGGFGIAGTTQSGSAKIISFPGAIVAHIWYAPEDSPGIDNLHGTEPYLDKKDAVKDKKEDPLKIEGNER